MATVERKLKYRCYDDCAISGCPSHEATLQFQTVSNAYTFNSGKMYSNGKADDIFFEQGELQALIDLLTSLNRADAIKINPSNLNTHD